MADIRFFLEMGAEASAKMNVHISA